MIKRDGPLTRDLLLTPGKFGLGKVPHRLAPDGVTTAVCGYCSTGCGLEIHLKDGAAVNVTPADYPVNLGMACPKGWEALAPLHAADRATKPLVRNARGRLTPVSWDRALNEFCTRMRAVMDKYGPESVAFLSTGQIPTEEMALLGALTKFGMGIVHGDGNTRQCMATAVVAYKQAFGFDAPPYCYDDFEQSDVIVLWGSNLCIAHPIMWERVCRNPGSPRVIVVDPRTTETASAATDHIPLAPKSDLALAYGLAHILIERAWIDYDFVAAHTSGFDVLAAHVAEYTPARTAELTGLSVEQIQSFARALHDGDRVSLWWTMGVNQSHEGVRTAQAIINLALLTGNIGRPGTGANSITGQCNAMGSRLFSNTTNLLGGHDFGNPDHRAKVAGVLGIDEAHIPTTAGKSYDQIIEGALKGEIKALWIVATNTAHSWINKLDLEAVFDGLELVVVQDMYATTETARRAHLVLPAAGWGEKEGTFINSERRIGRVKRIAPSPGRALADFSIFKLIAAYWGCEDMFEQWADPAAVFELLKQLSKDQPCDFSGIEDYAALDKAGGIQWPLRPGEEPAPSRRLFGDGVFHTEDGRAKLIVDEPAKPPEQPTRRFPLMLLTGRGSSSQWHTQTRTSKSAVLRKLSPTSAYVQINPADARKRAIRPNEIVKVVSPRGAVKARAFVTQTVQAGHIFMPMHYRVTNRLTFPAFDPHSRQPSYKACAADVRKLERWEQDQRRR